MTINAQEEKTMRPMDKSTILNQIASNDYLPSLSPLTIQLIGLAADEHSSILDLTRIIEKDPGLTARLLKIVNSAFYAHREPISSISYAVMVAGFNKIRVMALNISLKDTFPLGKVNGMDYDFFWKTSLYRAIIAQGLVKGSFLNERVDSEEVFTAGLILEIGLLLLFHLCPESLKESFPGGDVPLEEAIHWEKENIGMNHRELGRLTLEHWNFPGQFIETQNIFGPKAMEEGTSDFCKISEIARICTQLFFGGRDDFVLLKEIAGLLHMDFDRVSEILSEAFFKVEEFARELRLQINPDQDMLDVMGKADRALTKFNGSVEENIGKLAGIISNRNQETKGTSLKIPEDQKKNLETAMDAVAHEIRNPLMVIGGFAQRIMKKGHEKDEVVKYAELIARESHRLEKVLNDLMNSAGSVNSSKKP
jgi:HD-like signal output (HDOD) protein